MRHPVTKRPMISHVTIILTIIFAGFGLLFVFRCEWARDFFAAILRHLRHLAAPTFYIQPFRGDARCHLLLLIVTKSNHKLPNVTIPVTLINKGLAPKSDKGDVNGRLFAFSVRSMAGGWGPPSSPTTTSLIPSTIDQGARCCQNLFHILIIHLC